MVGRQGFLLERPSGRCYASFRECKFLKFNMTPENISSIGRYFFGEAMISGINVQFCGRMYEKIVSNSMCSTSLRPQLFCGVQHWNLMLTITCTSWYSKYPAQVLVYNVSNTSDLHIDVYIPTYIYIHIWIYIYIYICNIYISSSNSWDELFINHTFPQKIATTKIATSFGQEWVQQRRSRCWGQARSLEVFSFRGSWSRDPKVISHQGDSKLNVCMYRECYILSMYIAFVFTVNTFANLAS